MPLAPLLNRVPPGWGVLVWDGHTQMVVLTHSPQAKETTPCHHHEPAKSPLPSKSVYPQLSPAAGSMRQRGKAALMS